MAPFKQETTKMKALKLTTLAGTAIVAALALGACGKKDDAGMGAPGTGSTASPPPATTPTPSMPPADTATMTVPGTMTPTATMPSGPTSTTTTQ
jgi:hypothetical protein